MSSKLTHATRPFVYQKRVDLLESFLRQALLIGRRQLRQFGQIAALTRTCNALDSDRLDYQHLLSVLEDIAFDAEANAQLEIDLFEGLLAGRLFEQVDAELADSFATLH